MQRIHKVLQGLSLSAGAKVCLVERSVSSVLSSAVLLVVVGYFEMMRPSRCAKQ